MVAVVSAATAAPSNTMSVPKNPSGFIRPQTPSERDNAAAPRHPRTKEITSRYLSCYSSSSSSATSASNASYAAISSLSSSFSSRRFPSPMPTQRPSTPSIFSQGAAKRSQSVDRTRPSSSCTDPRGGGGARIPAGSKAAAALCTTTRSLSVSFQGESFFYQTSKAKAASRISHGKPTPARQRPTTPAKTSTDCTPVQSENSRPPDHHLRWPAARNRLSNPLTKSLNFSAEKNDVVTVQLLRQSMFSDDGSGRTSFDGAEFSTSSDTDSVSSGSISGTPFLNLSRNARAASLGTSVPARLVQETKSRLRRPQEAGTPLSSVSPRISATLNAASVRRSLVDNPLSSPRPSSSSLKGPVRPSSPSKLAAFTSRGIARPLQGKSSSTAAISLPTGLNMNAPSIISFAAEVRRTKKGENRIEEAHMLRLLHNRHLQWRCVDARVNAALMAQRMTAKKSLYNAWIKASEVRDLVTIKKIKLHLLMQQLKLTTILKDQMIFLEHWSLLDRDNSSSLSGVTEALIASTLRLPVVTGSRADLPEVKDAVGSALDMMQVMGTSTYSLMSKVEGTKALVSEIARVASHEQTLLNQSRNLLSIVEALYVKQCSLRSHLLQLKFRTSQI